MTGKIIISRNTLAENLAIVKRAAETNSQLPILSTILFKKDEEKLCLSATNLTMQISVRMQAEMEGDFNLTLPARKLSDIVHTLTGPEVVFSVNGKPEASLTSGSFSGVIKGIEASEFPLMPKTEDSKSINLNADLFRELCQQVAFAASTEDTRPVLTGVLMKLEGNHLTMVATDGFRLAMVKTELPEQMENQQWIISASVLKEFALIQHVNKSDKVTISFASKENQIGLYSESIRIVSHLIEGTFPDYQAILPKEFKTRVIINRSKLIKACKQVNIIARQGSNIVRLHLQPGTDEDGKLVLQAESDEAGKSEIELEAEIDGPELEIAFTIKFLLDGLGAISTEDVIIDLNDKNTPSVIHSPEEKESLYILMPVYRC